MAISGSLAWCCGCSSSNTVKAGAVASDFNKTLAACVGEEPRPRAVPKIRPLACILYIVRSNGWPFCLFCGSVVTNSSHCLEWPLLKCEISQRF